MSDDPVLAHRRNPISNSETSFWVYVTPNGTAKIHRAECHHARDSKWTDKPRVKAEDKNWSRFETYALARGFAERMQTKNFAYLSINCGDCKPGPGRNRGD